MNTADRLTYLEELREAASPGKLKAFRTSSGVMVLAWYDDEIRDYRVLAKFNIDQRVRNADEANAALAAEAPALIASCVAMAKAWERLWEAEQLGVYLEGPDSDYGGDALLTRKAVQAFLAALDTLPEKAEKDG